jgi:hypothetical protein
LQFYTPFCCVILPTKAITATESSSVSYLKYFFWRNSFALKWSPPHASMILLTLASLGIPLGKANGFAVKYDRNNLHEDDSSKYLQGENYPKALVYKN